MKIQEKEVYFDEYCDRCEYFEQKESEDPCAWCLSNPSNANSHKPMAYKEKDK